jgi:hypothetical protein
LLGCCLVICAGAGALAQDSTFVLIPGILGESQDPHHENWIEAYGLSATSTGGEGTAEPEHGDIYVLKGTDSSTPLLFLRLSQATNLGTVNIEVCRVHEDHLALHRLRESQELLRLLEPGRGEEWSLRLHALSPPCARHARCSPSRPCWP